MPCCKNLSPFARFLQFPAQLCPKMIFNGSSVWSWSCWFVWIRILLGLSVMSRLAALWGLITLNSVLSTESATTWKCYTSDCHRDKHKKLLIKYWVLKERQEWPENMYSSCPYFHRHSLCDPFSTCGLLTKLAPRTANGRFNVEFEISTAEGSPRSGRKTLGG